MSENFEIKKSGRAEFFCVVKDKLLEPNSYARQLRNTWREEIRQGGGNPNKFDQIAAGIAVGAITPPVITMVGILTDQPLITLGGMLVTGSEVAGVFVTWFNYKLGNFY